MLGSLGRLLPEHALAKLKDSLAKRASACAGPACQPVRSSGTSVQDQGSVFDEPCHQRMTHGNSVPNSTLELQLQRPQLSAHDADTDLGATIALAVVWWALLGGDRFQTLDAVLRLAQDLLHKLEDGVLAVALQDQPRVAEPCHHIGHQLHAEVVWIYALARHRMCKQALCLVTSDYQALDNLSSLDVVL